MAFWNRGRELRELRALVTSGLANPQPWMSDSFGHVPSPSGKRVSVKTALGVAPVWAAVSIIAEQIGQLPLTIYKDVDEDTRLEATQHRAWRMLHDAPNSHTSAGRFWSTVAVHLLLYGNAFIEKLRDDTGLVDELRILRPDWMTVYWSPTTGEKEFRYAPQNAPAGNYTQDEVLHIFGLSLDGIMGLSVIEMCRASFGTAMAREEFEGGFYNRGAVLSGVIQVKGSLKSQQAIDRLKNMFAPVFGGSGKAHQVAVLEEDAQYQPMSSPLRDLQFVEAQGLSRTDIAVMFKLPPNYLGGSSGDSLTYSTVESNQTQFALHAIAPWTHTIAQALSNDPGILPQNIFCAEFDMNAMLRADSLARAQYYKLMAEMQTMSRNEIRQREGFPPVPGGDKFDPPVQARTATTLSENPSTDGQQNGQLQLPQSPQVNGNGNGSAPPQPANQGA